MILGTIFYKDKIYNLDFSTSEEMEKILNSKRINKSYIIIKRAYEYKISQEITEKKIQNQLNSINSEINQINNKFSTSSKNYTLVKDEINSLMKEFSKIVKNISYEYDQKIEEKILIMLKYEIQFQKAMKSDDLEKIKETRNIIKSINKECINIHDEKISEIFYAMEIEERRMSTKIRKPRNFQKITRFFVNKFNTYNVITKNILNPIRQRMDDYLNQNLNIDEIEYKEFDIQEFEKKIDDMLKQM